MITVLLFIFFVTVGYLCGSVCSAVIVSTIFSLPDPRVTGSQNPGATNVLRISGKKYAAIVLLGDLLKGFLPVLFAQLLGANLFLVSCTGLAAVIGHIYPVFFGFKGGKGVATALGVLLGLQFILGVAVIATWLLVANLSRYASVASMVTMLLAPFYSLVITGIETFLPISVITLFIIYQHRNNITRLIDGEEPPIVFSHNTLLDEINATLVEQEQEEHIEQEEKRQKENPLELEEKTVPRKKRKVKTEPIEKPISRATKKNKK